MNVGMVIKLIPVLICALCANNALGAESPTNIASVIANVVGFSTRDEHPEISIQLDNNSSSPIYGASCDVLLLKNDAVVDEYPFNFSEYVWTDPGEATFDRGPFKKLTGYSDFDTIKIMCRWFEEKEDKRIDHSTAPVSIEFKGYTTFLENIPEVNMQFTNNSNDTLNFAVCYIEAKRGNVVVDVVLVDFANFGDIAPGERVDGKGTLTIVDSLSDFDHAQMTSDNFNCSYQVKQQ